MSCKIVQDVHDRKLGLMCQIGNISKVMRMNNLMLISKNVVVMYVIVIQKQVSGGRKLLLNLATPIVV